MNDSTGREMVNQGARITACCEYMSFALDCSFERALEIVAGVLIGLEDAWERAGLDVMESRFAAVEAKYAPRERGG